MNTRAAVSRFAVALSASALMVAAVPAMAPAKSVKVKSGTYKGSVLANAGQFGGDFRTPISISVSKGSVTKLVLTRYTLWAADQPSDVTSGGQPQGCQQAGTAPGSSFRARTFIPTITYRFLRNADGSASRGPVKIGRTGSFSVNANYGEGEVGSPISSVTYATTGNSAVPSTSGELSFRGRFSSSKKAKGTLNSLSIKLGAGIEQFTCNSYWAGGQNWRWGIPRAPK
jgi:hypothetical protein